MNQARILTSSRALAALSVYLLEALEIRHQRVDCGADKRFTVRIASEFSTQALSPDWHFARTVRFGRGATLDPFRDLSAIESTVASSCDRPKIRRCRAVRVLGGGFLLATAAIGPMAADTQSLIGLLPLRHEPGVSHGIADPTRLAVLGGSIEITVEYDRAGQRAPRVLCAPDDPLLPIHSKIQQGSVVLVVFMACHFELERLERKTPVRRSAHLFANKKIPAHIIRDMKCELHVVYRDITALHAPGDRRRDFVELAGHRTPGNHNAENENPDPTAHLRGGSPFSSLSTHSFAAAAGLTNL
jgi:hypothetical protein